MSALLINSSWWSWTWSPPPGWRRIIPIGVGLP